MVQQLFRKWWVILLQGILLIILGICIFANPVIVLAAISLWFGLIVLATGLLGIIAWLFADRSEKESISLLWSIISFVFGLMMVFNLIATMKLLTVFFGIWVLASGILLLARGWVIKDRNSLGWIMVITGVLSVIVAFMMIFNIGTGAIAISILLGVPVLLTGIGLVLLSIAKKALAGRVKDKIESMRS